MFKQYSIYLILAVSACLLMLAAFYNGYPLVYSDTSTYLSSGFELETPIDRPITYGLFLRLASLNGISLWLPVFVQSLLLIVLITRLLVILGVKRAELVSFVVSLVCVFTSGISWTASQLIADIFTPMLILLWAIICLDREITVKKMVFYGAFLFFVSSMHMSHFIMSALFFVFALIMRFNAHFKQYLSLKKIWLILISSAFSFLVFAASYSKFRHVFFVAKLNESGLLKKILDEKCTENNFKLCTYKDSLPATANEFMWGENSPLNKAGGYSEVKTEFNNIISIALTNSDYLKEVVYFSCKESGRQLVKYKIKDGNGVFMQGTKLYERMNRFVPSEISSYSNSKQQRAKLFDAESIDIFFTVCICSSLCVVLYFFFNKGTQIQLKLLALVFVAGIIINAVVCGTFAPIADRFGCRVVWMLILFSGIAIINSRSGPAEGLDSTKS